MFGDKIGTLRHAEIYKNGKALLSLGPRRQREKNIFTESSERVRCGVRLLSEAVVSEGCSCY